MAKSAVKTDSDKSASSVERVMDTINEGVATVKQSNIIREFVVNNNKTWAFVSDWCLFCQNITIRATHNQNRRTLSKKPFEAEK